MEYLEYFREINVNLCYMSDVLTPDQRHRNMVANRAYSTKPEQVLRHALWHRGFRYRLTDRSLPGKPDIVLPRYRTAIFVHGCFWHGHKGCNNYKTSKTNTDFWEAKVARNQERDQEVWRKLEAKGWCVIIVWECQLKKANLNETVERVASEIIRNGEAFHAALVERRKARETYLRERKTRKEKELSLLKEINNRAL
jgi:DNA mismatch endonuclease (patch repair protein)